MWSFFCHPPRNQTVDQNFRENVWRSGQRTCLLLAPVFNLGVWLTVWADYFRNIQSVNLFRPAETSVDVKCGHDFSVAVPSVFCRWCSNLVCAGLHCDITESHWVSSYSRTEQKFWPMTVVSAHMWAFNLKESMIMWGDSIKIRAWRCSGQCPIVLPAVICLSAPHGHSPFSAAADNH